MTASTDDDQFWHGLLTLADGSSEDVGTRLVSEDQDQIACAALGEVVARLELVDGPEQPVPVQFDLGVAGHRLGYVVSPAPARVEPGWLDDPWVLVRQDLAELLRMVFGPPDAPRRFAGRCG